MQIYSFCPQRQKILKIDLSVLSGLPSVHVLGNPDTVVKESVLRLKSAVLASGFKWSIREQWIFSGEHGDLDLKNNKGLDFALLYAYLVKTNQIKEPSEVKLILFAGLGLDGGLSAVGLGPLTLPLREDEIWVGPDFKSQDFEKRINIDNINEISLLGRKLKVKNNKMTSGKKSLLELTEGFDVKMRNLFLVILHGKHSCFLLGRHKDEARFFSQRLYEFLSFYPDKNREALGFRFFYKKLSEKDRLKGLCGTESVVHIENFFDFPKVDQRFFESLAQGFSARSFVASSTLCPCGLAELERSKRCGYSLNRCRSVVEKMSFNELDVFQLILSFKTKSIFKKQSSLQEVLTFDPEKALKKAKSLQLERQQKVVNSRLKLSELVKNLSEDARLLMSLPEAYGVKRLEAILSIARTCADLDGALLIEIRHIELALDFGFRDFKKVLDQF